ncbi:hypothetical protein NEDG_01194 [Nematocida displodere]|uniref:Uncharacterized protein n=1 Tax=Nematocida displodere TaxID=1805483 RepID=A0A177EAU9_9MICR|nr:hypothetical protein NEDG_01194 [Nematocida displodere]
MYKNTSISYNTYRTARNNGEAIELDYMGGYHSVQDADVEADADTDAIEIDNEELQEFGNFITPNPHSTSRNTLLTQRADSNAQLFAKSIKVGWYHMETPLFLLCYGILMFGVMCLSTYMDSEYTSLLSLVKVFLFGVLVVFLYFINTFWMCFKRIGRMAIKQPQLKYPNSSYYMHSGYFAVFLAIVGGLAVLQNWFFNSLGELWHHTTPQELRNRLCRSFFAFIGGSFSALLQVPSVQVFANHIPGFGSFLQRNSDADPAGATIGLYPTVSTEVFDQIMEIVLCLFTFMYTLKLWIFGKSRAFSVVNFFSLVTILITYTIAFYLSLISTMHWITESTEHLASVPHVLINRATLPFTGFALTLHLLWRIVYTTCFGVFVALTEMRTMSQINQSLSDTLRTSRTNPNPMLDLRKTHSRYNIGLLVVLGLVVCGLLVAISVSSVLFLGLAEYTKFVPLALPVA